MSELLYGRRGVLEALRARRRRFFRLWLEGAEAAEAAQGIMAEILAEAAELKLPTRAIDGGIFNKMRKEQHHAQGVVLEVGEYPYADLADCLQLARSRGEPPLLLLLDQVQDPQNLGTLVRSAEVLGLHGLVILSRRAVGVTPAVSNASGGAVERLLVAQVTNLNRAIAELKRQGVWVAGLDTAPEVPLLEETDLSGPLALVVGNESSGLSRLTREKCDLLVRLAMYGQVASYNAAVAGSIALYMARQARKPARPAGPQRRTASLSQSGDAGL